MLLLVGCTQTAVTRTPLSVSCEVTCEPGGPCIGSMDAVDAIQTDTSVLAMPQPEEAIR